jgi:hypothetical protein
MTIRWLAPGTWVDQQDPWRLADVAKKRDVPTALQTTAVWLMIAAALPHVRDALAKARLQAPENPDTRARAAAQLGMIQGWLDGYVKQATVTAASDAPSEPGYVGLAAMHLVDAVGATLGVAAERCQNALHAAYRARTWHHIAALMDQTRGRQYMTERQEELALAIKRGIPYPHPADFGLVAAHGDGWVLYHHFADIDRSYRMGQWSAQVLPQLLPSEQHGYLRTRDAREAIDFLGHRSPDAMREAISQLRADPQLGRVL